MASLTEQLPTFNSGRPIINPGPANPSLAGAIFDAASNSIPGVVNIGKERDRRTAQRQQAEADNALDEAAGAILAVRTGALNPQTPIPEYRQGGVPPIDAELAGAPIPQDAQTAAQDTIRARRAVEQGRAPQARYDLQLERVMSDLFAKYPEQRAEIANYFQSQGLDHYMFRAFETEQQYADASRDAQIRASTTQYNYAAERGLVTTNTSFEEGARIGREAMAREAEIEALKAEREEVRANRTLTLEEQKFQQQQLDRRLSGALIGQASIAVTPLLDSLTIAVSAAGNDAERQQILGEANTRAKAALISSRNRGVAELAAANASADEIKYYTDYMDGVIESVDSLINTSLEANNKSLRNLSAAMGIDMMQAAPIYSRISTLLGPQAANALLEGIDGTVGLDPEFLKAAQNEIRNFDPTNPRGTMNLARAIGYLRGEVGLKDLTAEEAQAYLRANRTTIEANQRAVLGGDTNAVRPWMANYGNVAEAVLELSPTGTSLASIDSASRQFATPESRRALEAAFKADPEYADALAQGGRSAAAKALLIARDQRVEGTPWSVTYDANQGRFVATVTQENYTAWAATQRGRSSASPGMGNYQATWSRDSTVPSGVALPTRDEIISGGAPTAINTQLATTNRLLTHLVETDKYDEAIPSNLSNRERRNLYGAGQTPDALRQQPEALTQDSEWGKIVNNLDTQIQNLLVGSTTRPIASLETAPPPSSELQSRVQREAQAYDLPWGLVERVVRKESNWNPGAENTVTNARGLFQINDDNANRTLDQNISDGLNLLKEAEQTATRTLGRQAEDWEVYVVHQQGVGGGPALLNPANATKNAVEVLTPIYGNSRLARQAVTANGGNVNMTSAEFLQSIRTFYER